MVLQKFVAYSILILVFFLLSDFMILFIITFLLAYLFYIFSKAIRDKISLLTKHYIKNIKLLKFINWFNKINIIVTILYIFAIFCLVYVVSNLLPQIIQELKELPNKIPFLANSLQSTISNLEEIKQVNKTIQWSISALATEKNIDILINVIEKLKHFGAIAVKTIIAIVLSYFFIIDRIKLKQYLKSIKGWVFAFFYKEYSIIFGKISKWFWLILKAQSLIAIINTILTAFSLWMLWLFFWWHFPFILTLSIIVFIFSFIPVLWVILSSAPIMIIWFTFWWINAVISIIVIILAIHALEAYVLNPRIVSSYVKLPISLTFLILIVSEHLFWPIWLLIGVPCFYIVVDIMKDISDYVITKNSKTS